MSKQATKTKTAQVVITMLPCPFCGEDTEISPDKSGSFWIVECGWCGAVGPNAVSIKEAAQNWNDRLTKAKRDARERETNTGEDWFPGDTFGVELDDATATVDAMRLYNEITRPQDA